MRIRWKAKPGYGDVISPICYAHNLSEHLQTKVWLEFVHFNPEGVRDRYEAPDTDDSSFIGGNLFALVRKGDSEVELLRTYNENMPVQHTNLFDKNKFHNYRLASNNWMQPGNASRRGNYVTFITTEQNKVPFTDYPVPSAKLWKDPVSDWSTIYDRFESKKFVSYQTPLADAIQTLLHTKLAIGYHGSAMWLARFLGVPSVIISGNRKLTERSFPNAVVLSEFAMDDTLQQEATNRTLKSMYKLHQHRKKGTVIWMPE